MSQQPLLGGVDRKTIVQIVAILMAIGGVLGICGGIALVGLGGIVGIGSVGVAPLAGTSEGAAAVAAGAGAGILAAITGIVLLVEGVLSVVVAYGLFTRQPWARMGTVIVAGIGILGQVLSLLTGGGFSAIIQGAIYAFIAYFFYTDAELKAYLDRP
jgi:hypothetical protein